MGIKRGNMKSPFFKSLLLAGALLLAWNCTDDTTIPTNLGPLSDKTESVWVINIGENNNLYIAEDGTVYDTQWNVFGTFSEGNIVTSENEIFMVGVDTTNRPMAKVIVAADGTKMVEFDDGTVTDTEGNEIGTVDDSGNIVNENGEVIAESPTKPTVTSSASGTNPTSAATNPGGNSAASTSSNSNGGNNNPPASSAAQQQSGQCGEKECYDAVSGSCVGRYDNLRGPHDEQYAYDKSCTMNCYYDPTGKNCKDMGGGSVTPKSSASQNPSQSSSSSKPKSSSSSKQQTQSSGSQQSGGCPNIKVIGNSQSGWASRYWDCSKPHCSWQEHGGNYRARMCGKDGKTLITNPSEPSILDGGNATTCFGQVPFTVSGCSNMAFAFAAVPGNSSLCGKCFQLTFNGGKNYGDPDANHAKLKGKKLIVMASNIGYDVSGGQFDIMIPGGGVGQKNGCANQLPGVNQGNQEGGFLRDCESETGYNASKYASCVINKCDKAFANYPELKEGCKFIATWMEAAGNPKHDYVEVECPQVLKDKY